MFAPSICDSVYSKTVNLCNRTVISKMSRKNSVHRTSRLYYRDWVHVKLQEEMYRRLFAQLQGREILFYADESKSMASGGQCEMRMNLDDLYKIELLCDRRLAEPEHIIALKFSDGTRAKLRVKGLDERNAWDRYIRAAGLHELTNRVNMLLPGQIRELEDIIKIESELMPEYEIMKPTTDEPMFDYELMNITKTEPMPEYENPVDPNTSANPWLFMSPMQRHDAEEILRNAENGNMLIRRRPSESNAGESCAFAVSVMSSPMSFKHYRVQWNGEEFVVGIKGTNHDRLQNYEDIIEYFENRTDGEYRRISSVVPIPDHPYEDHLVPVYMNPSGPHYCNIPNSSRNNHH